MQQEKRCCPLCGGEGHEVRRQAAVRKKKLVERVTMVCLRHEEATINWSNFESSITRYGNMEGRRLQSEAMKKHYAELDQRARDYASKHPERIAPGAFRAAADEPVELSPTVKAIRDLEEDEEAAEKRRKKLIRRRVQTFGS